MIAHEDQRTWLAQHTARRFGDDPLNPNGIGVTSVLPQFFGGDERPDALDAGRAWTGGLFASLDRHDELIASGQVAALETPVTRIFRARDEYPSPSLARHLSTLFGHASIHVVDDASRRLQWENPDAVARIIEDGLW